MNKTLRVIAMGLGGLVVALVLTVGAFAIAGQQIAQPAGVPIFTTDDAVAHARTTIGARVRLPSTSAPRARRRRSTITAEARASRRREVRAVRTTAAAPGVTRRRVRATRGAVRATRSRLGTRAFGIGLGRARRRLNAGSLTPP